MKKFIFGILALCLAGCQPSSSSPKQVLRINFHSDPPTLDPRKGGDLISSNAQYLLFEGLTRIEKDGSVGLGLAKKIDISEDKLTYTFHLRDAKWSNGEPITAHDFEYAWKTLLDAKFPSFCSQLLYPIKGAKAAKQDLISSQEIGAHAVDDKTLVVELEHPTPYFLDLTSFCVLCPVHPATDQADHQWSEGPPHSFVCNGAFRLVEWKHRDRLVVERNPYYWDKDAVHLEKIYISLIEDQNTALQLFEKGKLDAIGEALTAIPYDALPKYTQLQKIKKAPIPATTSCSFNVSHPLLKNVHIRKALALSINRPEIVQNITMPDQTPAYSVLHPTLTSWREKIPLQDIAAAAYFKKGLDELKLSKEDLKPIKLLYSKTELNYKIAQTLQNQWKTTLGIDVQIELAESKVYFNKLMKRDFDAAIIYMRAHYPDPMSILERFQDLYNPKNYPGWFNSQYARLLEKQKFVTSPEERDVLLLEALQILSDEIPLTPIFHWCDAFMHAPYVEDILICPRRIGLQWAKIVDEKR